MSAPHQPSQRGGALLVAMLVVALVATLASAAYWRQWQSWNVERAERQRAQATQVLAGALDWARFILREDARASQVDHLGEPWSVPLSETRISTFLAADRRAPPEGLVDAFLSGQIQDMQGRINLRNLLSADPRRAALSPSDVLMVRRLFSLLGLPAAELDTLLERLPLAWAVSAEPGDDAPDAPRGVRPQQLDQLLPLGLSAPTLLRLAPHATWLPERTLININTATATVLQASIDGLSPAEAQRLVNQRAERHYENLTDLRGELQALAGRISPLRHTTRSRFFTVRGQLRIDDMVFEQTALLERQGARVEIVWRQQGRLRLRTTATSAAR